MPKTGSFINTVYDENRPPMKPEKGMACTILMWSDRIAATVVSVTSAGNCIIVQEDTAKRTDGRGMSDAQTYEYERNPKGLTHIYSLRKNGKWIRKGEPMRSGLGLLLGKRDHHHDFSF